MFYMQFYLIFNKIVCGVIIEDKLFHFQIKSIFCYSCVLGMENLF
jgi:hypothetical protein